MSTNIKDTPLCQAVKDQDLEAVRSLINKEVLIDECGADGVRPIDIASEKGYLEIVKILLENGANVNAMNINEDPPMVAAVKNGRLAIVCELMRYNSDIKACKPDCDPPLVIAIDKEYFDIIIKLLENGAAVDACRRDGDPPLVIAASKNNLKIVYALLKYEPNINACKVDGDPPIIIATKNRNLEMVCALLNAKAEVNACWRLGDPSLVLAAENDDVDIVRELLKYEPRVDACRANGEPPLVIAVKNGNMEMVNDLLEAKADVNAFNADPALVVALQKKNYNIAYKILDYNPDVNRCGYGGNTALIIAAEIGNLDMVCKLLDMGANAMQENKNGLTPLMAAMENKHTEIVKRLEKYVDDMKNDAKYFLTAAKHGFIDILHKIIPYHSNIDVCDSSGNTALILAAQGGHSEIVCKLIEMGANIMKENNNRNTPLGLAALNGQLEVVTILLDRGAKINHKNFDGDTPIILAAESGHSEVITKLIEYGADIRDKNNYDITPITKAAEMGHLHIVRQLKDYGADISNGITISPLDAAARNGHLDCVKELIQLGADITTHTIQGALISNHVLTAQELLKIVSVFNIDDKTRLLKWVTLNHHDEIKRLITNKLLLRAEYDAFQNLTILEIACYQWANVVTSKTIELLLNEGADPKRIYPTWQNRSAIHFATMGQNPSILYQIASRFDVDINSVAQDKNALIMLIVDGDSSKSFNDFNECAYILCDKDIDIHFNKYLKKSALTLAAERGYTQIINILLAKDNNITSEEEVTLKKLSGNFNYTTATQPVVTGASFLRNGNEEGFVTWYVENRDYENQHLGNESFLQTACNKHFIKVVNCLIQINPNQVGSREKTHPLIIAIKNGYFKLVELFLGASNMNLPPNVLNVALKHVHKKSSTNIDYRKTCLLILENTKSVNERDSSNNKEYPLHNAVKYADADIISRLLNLKASLANRDLFENLTIKGIDYDVLKEHFDNCIHQISDDEKKYLSFDYSTIIPTVESNKPIKETCAVLQMALDIKQRPLLQHPLISSFLRTKWQKVRSLFLANFVLYLLFCIFLWSFIANNYNKSNNLPKDGLYIFLCMLTSFIILREFLQIKCMSSNYWTNVDNYLEIGLLIDVCLMLTTNQNMQPKFAIAILLSSVELLLLLGNIPGMSTYITMLRTVAYNFVTFFLFTSILVLAFGFSFYILFHEFAANPDNMTTNQINMSLGQNNNELINTNSTDFFSTIPLAIFKTLIMFSGEIEASSLNMTQFPGFSHLFVICFTFLIVIILSNLLNGIAVSDTQKIKNEAKLIALKSQAEYLNTIETTIYNWPFLRHFQKQLSFNCIFTENTLKVDITEELSRKNMYRKLPINIPKFIQYFITLSDSTIQEAQLIVCERENEVRQTKVNINIEIITLKKMFGEFRNEMDAIKTVLNIIKNNLNTK